MGTQGRGGGVPNPWEARGQGRRPQVRNRRGGGIPARGERGRHRREPSEGDSPLRSAGPPTTPGRRTPLSQGARRERHRTPSRGCQDASLSTRRPPSLNPPEARAPSADAPTSAFSARPGERGAGSGQGRRQSGPAGRGRPLAAVLHRRALRRRRGQVQPSI